MELQRWEVAVGYTSEYHDAVMKIIQEQGQNIEEVPDNPNFPGLHCVEADGTVDFFVNCMAAGASSCSRR